MTHTTSDRVQVRRLGELQHPAACALCGSGNADFYVDTGVWYDYEGQVYFCFGGVNTCMEQMLELIGGITGADAEKYRQQVNDALTLAERVEGENAVLRNQLNAWNSVLSVTGNHLPSLHDVAEKPEDKPVGDSGTPKRPKTRKPEVKEPVAEQGSNDSVESKLSNGDRPVL